jgi:hypothetical protein
VLCFAYLILTKSHEVETLIIYSFCVCVVLGLTLARQVLYHLSHTTSSILFCFVLRWDLALCLASLDRDLPVCDDSSVLPCPAIG